jgi:hypothetical protein
VSAVGDARKRATEAAGKPRWTDLFGIDPDYVTDAVTDEAIARATAADTVLATARRLCCGNNPAPHHAATDAHSQRMAFAEELARAVRHA